MNKEQNGACGTSLYFYRARLSLYLFQDKQHFINKKFTTS
nr:MAG TPA: Protein of unknown function (DUF2968) [Caudoviricetes sp.]